MTDVVDKLWGFCHVLRHDGIDYGAYIEQITYLLFLKMADERGIELPKDCDWTTLTRRSGTELADQYADLLRTLSHQPGLLGDVFAGARSAFSNPVNLKRLIGMIDETAWTALPVDVKGAAFEGLLEKAASEGKKGAGQYFTPRILIWSIVRCMRPDPRGRREFTVMDPACGTGGFLMVAHEWLMDETGGGAVDRDLAKRLRHGTYYGQDLVPTPRRLALMNLYLHGLEPEITLGDSIYEAPAGRRYDLVLTNPPFGTKGANSVPDRDDFTAATSNKQLNFLQHVLTVLKPGGRAAVVVPDNCLFADQAGEVFEILTKDCDLHTVLRLPRGTFTPYSPGTKTNVVFFTKSPSRQGPGTERVWIYDARTNVPAITKKDRPLTPEHFAPFERCYGPDPNGRAHRAESDSADNRWRSFGIDEVKARDYKLDSLKWLREELDDDPDDLPEPEELATDAIGELEAAVEELNAILALLESGNGVELQAATVERPA
jgi:type I restriction enzyme M protein